MKMAVFLLFLPLVSGHYNAEQSDNCVDISRYSAVRYNSSVEDICTYSTSHVCTKKQSMVCVDVPVTSCKAVGHLTCQSAPFTGLYNDDTTVREPFIGKDCILDGSKSIVQKQRVPVCNTVFKEQCDSVWSLAPFGEEFWEGTENCKTISWKECTLNTTSTIIEVPVYTCTDIPPVYFTRPVIRQVEVTGYRTSCTVHAVPVCTDTTVQQCVKVDYEECEDVIKTVCLGEGVLFRMPYQKFIHRLKCI